MMRVFRAFLLLTVSLILQALSVESYARRKSAAEPSDTSAISCRGVLECFASVSEGIGERLDFYSSKQLTHYFYSPSDDRYCNRWGWKFLYNDADRHTVMSLDRMCRDKGLEFVWTVNPGGMKEWSPSDYRFLVDKLIMMYYNGLRSFAVNFSDTDGEHVAVRDSLIRDFVTTRKDKVNLYILNDLPAVTYPSSGESGVETLMRGYHFDKEFITSAVSCGAMLCRLSGIDGFSRLAVSAVADCSLAPDSYSPDRSMTEAVSTLNPEVKEAFITFLNHTGKVQESPDVEVFTLEEWSREKSDALYREFDKLEKVAEQMGRYADSGILASLKPWLVEFGRLGVRGKKVLECMNHYISGDIANFWLGYISGMITPQELADYQRYPVGSVKLQPFCVDSMNRMVEGFSSMLTGKTMLHNLASTLYSAPNAALDSDFTTYIPSGGHIEFAIPALADTCHLLIGQLPADGQVLFRELATDGSLVAEFVVESPFSTFDLKEGAVKVDIIGDVLVYENIFINL